MTIGNDKNHILIVDDDRGIQTSLASFLERTGFKVSTAGDGMQALGENPLGGAYTEFVACGLTLECTDHQLRHFEIRSGEVNSGVRICDWYVPDKVLPRPQ